MDQSVPDNKDYVHEKGQWRMGIAALRRVRGIVDSVEEEERFKKAAARGVAVLIAVVLVAIVATLLISPAAIQGIFRLLS
jgi:hypothetical protein